MVTKEVDRESCRAAESQGGTTITIGAMTPLAISTSPESGPEGTRLYYRASTTFPPCGRCLDCQVGSLAPRRWTTTTTTTTTALDSCFGCPKTWKAHLTVLGLHLPPQSLRPRLRACVLCLRPRACVSYPRPRASVPCPCPYPRASALQAHTVYPGLLCCFGRA
jgi:hypothetical protein